jgi:para-nitrobenzyl esterase
MYDGEALARKGVVVVTFNYRLGPVGFFSYPELTKESDRRGAANFGVMDALAALQWVQRNIALGAHSLAIRRSLPDVTKWRS